MELAPRPPRSPRATTVDFYLYSGHEIAVWEPLWRCLRQRGIDAEFVLEPPERHRAMGSVPDPANGWFNDKDGRIVPLVDATTFASMAGVLAARGLGGIDRSRVHADAVITTQGIGWLDHYAPQCLRIKTEYGASAFVDVYGHGEINQGLDAVLAHGPFSARAISAHLPAQRIHRVGYPKWAPALRGGLDQAAARSELGLPSDQTIVAWLPTWAHNSTIDRYASALADLADDHLVVAKPHHNNLRFEIDRLGAVDSRIVVRADLHSLVPLMIAADVVVADSRSGALAESIIADRPAVGLLPGIDARTNGMLAGFDEAVVWCHQPDRLRGAIIDALAIDRSLGRQTWRSWLFSACDGNDDQVAARVVIDLIHAGRQRGTASLPIAELDALIDETSTSDPAAVMETLFTAWPLWPGHPRLCGLVGAASGSLDATQLAKVSRTVRSTGHISSCPLVALVADPATDPVRRLVAAALAAEEFEDEGAAARFPELAAAVPPGDLATALNCLDDVPSAIPAFVAAAATTPERCDALAAALELLGAAEEAGALTRHGRSLVLQ